MTSPQDLELQRSTLLRDYRGILLKFARSFANQASDRNGLGDPKGGRLRLTVVLSWVIGLALPACIAQTELLPSRVAKAAQDRVAAGTYPAVVIGVVDGAKSDVYAFGKLPDGGTPDRDTVFEIGSVTKTFTALLLAEAVQSGRVQLDQPVDKLLPDFKIPGRGGKPITLLDIATQHSGLPRMPSNFSPADPLNPYADYDASKLKEFLAGYELPREPGATYEYSNLAVGLLGYGLAQSEEMTYGALVAAKIFEPLGMTMSSTSFTDRMRAHLAPGFDAEGKPVKNWDLAALAGAGAIRSTAADMLLYLRANMGVDQTPLTPAMKFAQQPRSDLGHHDHIGLIWMTRSDPQGEVVWHNGMTGGYASFIGFTADGRHGVVALSNSAVSLDDIGFATLLTDAPLAPAHIAIPMPPNSLEQYVGTYKLRDHFLLQINRSTHGLYAQATGQSPFPIFASAHDEFFAKIAPIGISFTRDSAGSISGLVLHQGGDHVAPKLGAADLPEEPKAISLDATTLRDYVGKFQLTPNAVIDVTLTETQLSVQLTGQPAFPVFASAKDKFFLKVVEAQIDFERDATGTVVALVLHQNGKDRRAPRAAPGGR